MAILEEGYRDLEFVVSEANGFRSRKTVTVDASGAALEPGTLLGQVTASGDFVRHDPGADTGEETVAGILAYAIGEEEAERTIIARDAEVNRAHLTYSDGADQTARDAADAALADLGIIVR